MASTVYKHIHPNSKDFYINIEESAGQIGLNEAGKLKPLRIEKSWGYELHWVNTNLYCMKLLNINQGQGTSLHTHLEKHETMYVVHGELWIDTINREFITDNVPRSFVIYEGESFVIPPGFTHKLICALHSDYVELIECSTFSEDLDSIRLIDV